MKVYVFDGAGPGKGKRAGVVSGTRCAPLDPRTDLWDYGAVGPDWSNGVTPGALQLALAVIADATGFDALAIDHHQAFARKAFANASADGFAVHEAAVIAWLLEQSAEASPYTSLTIALTESKGEGERENGRPRDVQ